MADLTAFLAASIALDGFITMEKFEHSRTIDERRLRLGWENSQYCIRCT